MICTKCNRPLALCSCPELLERVENLFKSPHLYFSEAQKEVLRKQGRKNLEEKTITE